MARLLSVSVTDLMIKVPDGAVDIKELKVDTFKIAGPNHILGVKLHLLPLNLQLGDMLTADRRGSCNQLDAFQSDQASLASSEKYLAPFVCEDLLVTCEFGHEKERGVKIVNLELKCGDVTANIDGRLFDKKQTKPECNNVSENAGDAILGTSSVKQSSKSKFILPALKKQMLAFPDKVSFSVPKLDVKFTHLDKGLSVENNVMGIHFTTAKSLPQDDLEEATPHFDVQIDLSEIHLVREGSSSLLEVLKVAAVASLDIPVDPFLPIRAEIDAKLGGTQCNLMLSRLMRLHSLRTKGMKLSKANSHQETSQTKEVKPVIWTCTVSAPEMTVMLYSHNGLILYHACCQSSHLFANNIASKGIQIHTELGEMLVHMEDGYREFLKENIFGVDTCSGSLMHIARVEIHPLKIYLPETMYRMMWDYFFPEEDDSQRRQDIWRVSTSTGSRKTRIISSGTDAVASTSYSVKEHELPGKSGTTVSTSTNVSSWQGLHDNSQVSKLQSLKANMVCTSHPESWWTSSFERTWEESAAENITNNDVVSLLNSSNVSSKGNTTNSMAENHAAAAVMFRKTKDSKSIKSGRLSHEKKKIGKSRNEKRTRSRKLMEIHNIKISQVELLVTYEGSRLINDLWLLMDTFHHVEFTGTWRTLFPTVIMHIIKGVLKSVAGMQGKKFKAQNQRGSLDGIVPENDLNFSNSDGSEHGKPDQFPVSRLKRAGDGARDGFITEIRGLFNSQRRKAKAVVVRAMRGDGVNEYHDEWSDSNGKYSFARQLTITKAKKLPRRHTKKFRPRGQKSLGPTLQDSLPSSAPETTPYQSDSSESSYEDFHE